MTPERIAEIRRDYENGHPVSQKDAGDLLAALSTEPAHADVPRMRQWADDHLSRIRYGLTVPDAREHLYQLLCRAHAEGRRQGGDATEWPYDGPIDGRICQTCRREPCACPLPQAPR